MLSPRHRSNGRGALCNLAHASANGGSVFRSVVSSNFYNRAAPPMPRTPLQIESALFADLLRNRKKKKSTCPVGFDVYHESIGE